MASERKSGKSRKAAKSAPKASPRVPRVDAEPFTPEQKASQQRVRDALGTGKPGPKPSGKTVRCRVVGGMAKDARGHWLGHGMTGDFRVEQLPNRYVQKLK